MINNKTKKEPKQKTISKECEECKGFGYVENISWREECQDCKGEGFIQYRERNPKARR